MFWLGHYFGEKFVFGSFWAEAWRTLLNVSPVLQVLTGLSISLIVLSKEYYIDLLGCYAVVWLTSAFLQIRILDDLKSLAAPSPFLLPPAPISAIGEAGQL